MSTKKHRIVTLRMLTASAVVGVILSAASVPASALISAELFNTQNLRRPTPWAWLDYGDHQIYVDQRSDAFYTHWESAIVPDGMEDPPGTEFDRPINDPRPRYARRAYTGHVQSIVSLSAGWPSRAASGRAILDGTPRRTWEDGLYRVTIGTFSHRFPVSPIWTGLLANAIFYATITLALLTGLRLIRTRRRRTRNL
ncbi:MAG: hypothetical protein ACFCBV_04020, partial [Phycisphaerales bacterium]